MSSAARVTAALLIALAALASCDGDGDGGGDAARHLREAARASAEADSFHVETLASGQVVGEGDYHAPDRERTVLFARPDFPRAETIAIGSDTYFTDFEDPTRFVHATNDEPYLPQFVGYLSLLENARPVERSRSVYEYVIRPGFFSAGKVTGEATVRDGRVVRASFSFEIEGERSKFTFRFSRFGSAAPVRAPSVDIVSEYDQRVSSLARLFQQS